MPVEKENYELEILEYAVNQCIDRFLPESSEDALNVILYKSNEIIWRVATDIYTKSGHQIDFSFIQDILNLRIEPLRKKIAEEVIIRTELEAQSLVKIAEQERKEEEQKKLQELEIFIKIKNIIIEQLEVLEEIKLNTLFEYLIPESYNDWQNRIKKENTWCSSSCSISDKELHTIELVMAVEEEFDIEILDDECDNLLSWTVSQLVNLVLQKI